MTPNPNPSPELREYSVDDQGRFCRHCGRASWLHHRVIGGGNFCEAPDVSVGDRVRIRDDVRRFGGRIGTVERFHEESISQCPIELRLDDESTYCFRASEIERLAALSPQTLPAPGEVEPWTPDRFTLTERELDDECGCPEETWDTPFGVLHMHLSAGKPSNACLDNGDEGEWHIDLTATTIADARSAFFAWSMFAATLTPTLATVAAANDEGVARAFEAAAKVAELAAFGCEITTVDEKGWPTTGPGGAKHTADYIAAAIRLLSQGGGK